MWDTQYSDKRKQNPKRFPGKRLILLKADSKAPLKNTCQKQYKNAEAILIPPKYFVLYFSLIFIDKFIGTTSEPFVIIIK